jgi:hypothetical protein
MVKSNIFKYVQQNIKDITIYIKYITIYIYIYNKLNKSHLVGQLLNSIHDARTHVCKIYIKLMESE